MSDITFLDNKYTAHTYKRFPVELSHGSGSEVYSADGKRYIDMGSGIGVTSFGFADEKWTLAVTEQLSRLQHTSNLYYTEPCARLAKALCDKTDARRVFFSNSGAEANECAIKTARRWGESALGPEYNTIITLRNSFHGRTITTLAATGQDHYHEHFGPLTPGFVYADAEDTDGLARLIKENKCCAVMFECIQGEGGVIPMSREFVANIEKLAHDAGILIIVDEVQTGNGRTGKYFAYMNYGIRPDIVSTAKGLGGGLPIGATLLGERVCETLTPGDHGSTYGGNPVCCAGALSVVSRIDDTLLSEVSEKGKIIRDALTNAPGITDVSGMGLMIGIKTVAPAGDVIAECMKHGVLCLSAKDRVRLLPALNIPTELLREALDVILDVCKKTTD